MRAPAHVIGHLVLALVLLALTAPAAGARPSFGYPRGDVICRSTLAGFAVSWDTTPSSADAPPGATGRCGTTPPYVRQVAQTAARVRELEAALGFPRPIGPVSLQVMDVLGRKGRSGWTFAFGDGSCDIYVSTGLDATTLETTLAHEQFHAVQNAIVPDVFGRLPDWIVEGTATWMEVAAFPGDAGEVTPLATSLGGQATELPLTARGYAAWPFWYEVSAGAQRASVVRRLLFAVGKLGGHPISDSNAIRALGAATGGTLPAALREYGLDLITGAPIAGIDLPPALSGGLQRRPPLRADAVGGASTVVTVAPLAFRLQPIVLPAGTVVRIGLVGPTSADGASALTATAVVSADGSRTAVRHGGGRATIVLPARRRESTVTLVIADPLATPLRLRIQATAGR